MSLAVDQVDRAGDGDPRLFTLAVTIEYSVVTADAATAVGLDPSAFTVLDEDTGVTYLAEPATQPGDCAADVVVTRDGGPISCLVRFRLPAAVGALSAIDGGVHAELRFDALGLRGRRDWSY
jgi:hypothetical protein